MRLSMNAFSDFTTYAKETGSRLTDQPLLVEKTRHLNATQHEREVEAIRRSIQRGNPFGDEGWCDRTVRKLGLETTLRPRGRPKKPEKGS